MPDRRQFLQSLSAAAAVAAPKVAAATLPDILRAPDYVAALTAAGLTALTPRGGRWQQDDIVVTATPGRAVTIQAPRTPLSHVLLRWRATFPERTLFLGDHWERGYGDLEWRTSVPHRVMPWYFLASLGERTRGYGVATGGGAIAFWQTDADGVSLWLDIRNGGSRIELGERTLEAAVIRQTTVEPGRSPYLTARALCTALCPKPRLPKQPVYGGNNWYYTYGKNFTAADIVRDSKIIAELADNTANRPFMLIDDGWMKADRGAGPNSETGPGFPDMPRLAADMRAAGARTGIWIRPLLTVEQLPEAWRLEQSAKRIPAPFFIMDPSLPDALEHIRASVRLVRDWGFELIKHDYSTYDLLGRWGFQMGTTLTDSGWHFRDRSRTTAEIIRDFYQAIREAAGESMLIGCNTIGHLGAGLFELQRIGDDTSGREWERTRKMGVNTLAFRAPQHETFFAADPDCVPVTPPIPWELTREWLDLSARSGMPLFVSMDPACAGPEQRKAIREAFTRAAVPQPPPEPLDWMTTTAPRRWRLNGKEFTYQWYPANGSFPFAN